MTSLALSKSLRLTRIRGDSFMNFMNNDDTTTGAPMQSNIVCLHPNPSQLVRNGISNSPTPLKARRIGGPSFCKFSLEISKNRMIEELKKPRWKKLQAKNAKLNRYSEGQKTEAQQAIPMNSRVSSMIELKEISNQKHITISPNGTPSIRHSKANQHSRQ